MEPYSDGSPLTVVSGVGQAGTHPFPQDFSFELRTQILAMVNVGVTDYRDSPRALFPTRKLSR